MTHLTDRWVVPWLALLADWSIRWGIALTLLAIWFALRPPRRTPVRYFLCLAALAAGVLFPIAPRWGNAMISWPSQDARTAAGSPTSVSPSTGPYGPGTGLPLSRETTEPASQLRFQEAAPRREPARAFAPMHRLWVTIALLGPWRIAALVASIGWALVVLVLLSRLAGGWLMLARLRHGVVVAGWRSDGLLDECRAVLGLSRDVGIAVHPTVASPVVIGGLRPVVLVPTDWGDWPESHRRASLLHELAHLARYDDWAKLAQEVIRAHFFFHPLVRWLLTRLDREREILCDEAAVALGSDPVVYARLLFDLARRPRGLFPVTPLSLHGWLPFLDRRTVEVRIERLLEKEMLNTLSPPSTGRSLGLGGLAMLAALTVGGLRVQGGAGPTGPPPRSEATAQIPGRTDDPAPVVAKEAPRELRGVVLDPDDHPVADATIVAGSFDVGQSGHQVIKTDAGGRFSWTQPAGSKVVSLVVFKEGFAVAERSVSSYAPEDLQNLKIRLGKTELFAAVLVDGEGKPIAGAKVQVEMIAQAIEQKNSRGSSIMTGFTYVHREVTTGSPVEGLFATTTDAGGSFAFGALGQGAGLKLGVTAADGRRMRVKPGSSEVGHVRQTLQNQGFVTAPPGEATRLSAISTARVAGRVVSTLPGVEVSKLTASFQESHQPNVYRPSGNFSAMVPTDSEGRFVFDGLNEGTVNVFVHGDGENQQWTYRAAKDVSLTPGKTSEVTLELIRGVEVGGTVVAQWTGAPLAGAQAGVYGPFRPKTGAMTTGAKTDAQGRYRYRLPSGETYFYVMGPPSGFTGLSDEGSSRTVTIPEGASSYEVPPIELAAAVTVRGKVLDAAGTPVNGATVVGLCEGGLCRPFGGAETITDTLGEFRLPPARNNTVAIGKPARLLVRLRNGTEHDVAILPAEDGAVFVKLSVAGNAPSTTP